jgi:hypothetical protein
VVSYWTRMHGVIGLNPGQVKFFFLSCSCHVVILHYTKNYFPKVLNLPKIKNHISLHGPTVSGTSANSTSQVCLFTMLVLPIVENWKVWFYCSPKLHNVYTKFHPNPSSGSWVESCRQTDKTSPKCVHFMHIVQRKQKRRNQNSFQAFRK